jgi:hypothetical protein
VATFQTKAEVDPIVPRFQTLFAPLRSTRRDLSNFIKMGTNFHVVPFITVSWDCSFYSIERLSVILADRLIFISRASNPLLRLSPSLVYAWFRAFTPLLRESQIIDVAFGAASIIGGRIVAIEGSTRAESLG